MIFGQRDLWAIEVDPLPGAPVEHDPAAAATWCSIRLWVESRNLTAYTRKQSSSPSRALHWPAAYLARWFVRSWSGFWERAGWPLPGAIVDAEIACRKLDERLAELGPDAEDDLLDRRDEFVASHSLLAAASGGLMPHIYLMREGPTVHVTWREPTANDSDVAFHERQGHARLEAGVFLDAVVEFLQWCQKVVAGHDPDLVTEIDQWLARIDRPEAAEAVLRGYMRPWGVPASRCALHDIDPRLGLPVSWRSAGARLDPSRFSAAVVFRALAPAVNVDDVLVLLDRLRSYPSVPEASRKLDALRSRLVVPSSEPSYQQGYSLAEQLRMAWNNPDAYVDIEAFLAEIGVKVDTADLSDVTIDGATVWGPEHGPVIVLNQLGVRQESWARRMILAHEFCHLLVDRQAAAELMVASTPWAPPELERRANAFAAELLLPKAGIQRVARDAVRSGWVGEEARVKLMAEFKVGATVCNHQLENRLRISD
jgi:Zn-dependent peptidase ImmA (M78 family)